MFYTYVLKGLKDNKLYIGRSDNLKRRIAEHNSGKVTSTKNRRPLKLIFYEAFNAKDDSIRREKYFKTNKGRSSLKQILRYSLL